MSDDINEHSKPYKAPHIVRNVELNGWELQLLSDVLRKVHFAPCPALELASRLELLARGIGPEERYLETLDKNGIERRFVKTQEKKGKK